MANWKFDLWITDDASLEYGRLRSMAESAIFGYDGPLPINSDPRLSSRLASINHYERTRTILQSIVKPGDIGLDRSLMGVFSHVKYRTDLGTCVYFTRLLDPLAVIVYGFKESPLDYDALRGLILSGNGNLIAKLGLPIPVSLPAQLTIH